MCTVYCAYHAVSKSQTNKNNCQIMLKRAETDGVLIIFKGVSYHIHTYTVTISYSPLYINQVPEMFTFITKYTEVLFDSCISTQNHMITG